MPINKENMNSWLYQPIMDTHPRMEVEGKEFSYVVKHECDNLRFKNIKLIEQSLAESTMFVPILFTAQFLEFISKNKREKREFTIDLFFDKIGYVVNLFNASFGEVSDSIMGNTVYLEVKFSYLDVKKIPQDTAEKNQAGVGIRCPSCNGFVKMYKGQFSKVQKGGEVIKRCNNCATRFTVEPNTGTESDKLFLGKLLTK